MNRASLGAFCAARAAIVPAGGSRGVSRARGACGAPGAGEGPRRGRGRAQTAGGSAHGRRRRGLRARPAGGRREQAGRRAGQAGGAHDGGPRACPPPPPPLPRSESSPRSRSRWRRRPPPASTPPSHGPSPAPRAKLRVSGPWEGAERGGGAPSLDAGRAGSERPHRRAGTRVREGQGAHRAAESTRDRPPPEPLLRTPARLQRRAAGRPLLAAFQLPPGHAARRRWLTIS